MSRYIDAEWLIKESMPLNFSVQKWVNEVQIMTAPSIDICFCRDCKKRDDDYVCYKWASVDECPQVRPDDFCSYGEREGE